MNKKDSEKIEERSSIIIVLPYSRLYNIFYSLITVILIEASEDYIMRSLLYYIGYLVRPGAIQSEKAQLL